jgi:hypothetical protein
MIFPSHCHGPVHLLKRSYLAFTHKTPPALVLSTNVLGDLFKAALKRYPPGRAFPALPCSM